MVPAGSWRDQFKIDDKIVKAFWDEFSESSPLRASELTLATASSAIEFILWCVHEGHFSESDFTQFQSKQYNLPIVRAEFFETPVDHALWDRVKDIHAWTASCFPLTEWDGHLLIGSVWPTEKFKSSIVHQLVLGTPSHLREFHARLVDRQRAVASLQAPTERIEDSVLKDPRKEKKSAKTKPKFDDGDPFAALSRQLGMVNDDTTPSADNFGDADANAELVSATPDGFVMPEGLSFSKEEISRLTATGAHDGPSVPETKPETKPDASVVKDGFFENADDVTPEPRAPMTDDASGEVIVEAPAAAHSLEMLAPAMELTLDEKNHEDRTPTKDVKLMPHQMESMDPFDQLAAELKLETENEDDSTLEGTQPSAVIPPTSPKLFEKETPVMPFTPIVTPSAPAMVKPLAPVVAEAAKVKNPYAPTAAPRPAAEATIVVSAKTEAAVPTTKIRKPLFEPVANPQAGSTAGASNTQSGQTAARQRRLENTPVTSFFGIGGPKNSGRVRVEAYSKRAITISKIEPLHLDQCTSVDEAGVQALLQASNIFETAMILLFKDGELQPWKWNDLFLSINGEKPESIDLKQPSIFKVVFRTAKPYHGYVVTSEANQKFFNEFYRGMLPKHATVIPIMIDGRMGGMMLAFTNSKIDYRQSLRLMERLAFDLGRVFKTMRGTMSKAS